MIERTVWSKAEVSELTMEEEEAQEEEEAPSLDDDDDHARLVDGLVWGGAVDARVPPLEAGATFVHSVSVGLRAPEEEEAPYRIQIECVVNGEVIGESVCEVK